MKLFENLKTTNQNIEQWVQYALTVSFLSYIVLRAIFVPIVHDEFASYTYYVQNNNFLPYLSHQDANNHFVNSALASACYHLFGNHWLVLRIPNVLAAGLFAFYVLQFAKLLKHPSTRIALVLALLLSHNFIEFFAYERGYGLSFAFLFGAIYHLYQSFRSSQLKHHILFAIWLSLSLFANVILIYTGLILFAIYILDKFLQRTTPLKKSIPIIVFLVIALGFIIKLLFSYREAGLLYSGSPEGFWMTTVASLVKQLTERLSVLHFFLLVYPSFFLILLLVLHIKNHSFWSYCKTSGGIFNLAFAGNIAAIILGHYLFGINFPDERLGLQLFPLLIGAFVFAVDQFDAKEWKLARLIIVAPMCFFPIHFAFNANLDHSSLWTRECIPPSFYKHLDEESKKGENLNLGAYATNHFNWSYYIQRGNFKVPHAQCSLYPDTLHQYQIVDTASLHLFDPYYTPVLYSESASLYLMKRKQEIKKTLLFTIEEKEVVKDTNKLFVGLHKEAATRVANKTLYVEYEMNIQSSEHPFNAQLVFVSKDSSGVANQYQYIALNWKNARYEGNKVNFKDALFTQAIDPTSDRIESYIWNIDRTKFSVTKLKMKVYTVD
jgi:hypothetical protein